MKQFILRNQLILLAAVILFFTNSCKKNDDTVTTSFETDSITDIDGNVYKTVKIGKQWWMAENLRVSKYRDSTSIFEFQSDTSQWRQDTLGAYCVYNGNTNSPGFLYNWYAVNNLKKIAPAGWHVPSDEEWKQLEMHLGMNMAEAEKVKWRGSHEGEKLKIKSPEGWTLFEEIWSSNESGFTALAGGCRLFDGIWGDPGLSSTGFWWSSSEFPDNLAWYRHLDYKNANVFRYYGLKNYGFSVRCVKN